MDNYSRKTASQSPANIPPPAPANPVTEDEDCGCHGQTTIPGTGTGGGVCPGSTYTTGDFDFVVRNKTTGKCEKVSLDYIEDSQPIFIAP